VYCHPKFAQGDVDGLTHIRKREAIKSKKTKHVHAPIDRVDDRTRTTTTQTTNPLCFSLTDSPTHGRGLDMLTRAFKFVLEEESHSKMNNAKSFC
jgi:hypothetical protein